MVPVDEPGEPELPGAGEPELPGAGLVPLGGLPVVVLFEPGPAGPAAFRLSRQRVRSFALVIARQACSCWAFD